MRSTEPSNGHPARVLIVEDDRIFREGLRAVLTPFADQVAIVDAVANASDAVDRVRMLRPDIVLLDLRLPKQSAQCRPRREHGLGVIAQVKRIASSTRILILSNYDEGPEALFDALVAGANGYIAKGDNYAGPELVDALQRILAGQAMYGPTVAEMMRQTFISAHAHSRSDRRLEPLTITEHDVLKGISEGKPFDEIAAERGLSLGETYRHASDVLTKLQTDSGRSPGRA